MKKLISLMLIVSVLISMSIPMFATNTNEMMKTFSLVNENGDDVTVVVDVSSNSNTTKVYINGVLTQKSIANLNEKTIITEIYDQKTTKNLINEKNEYMNDFKFITVYKPISTEIASKNEKVQPRMLYTEPVDNTGLSLCPYGDGYYSLGCEGGYAYAPSVTGCLYRKYTQTYDGETKHYKWGAWNCT